MKVHESGIGDYHIKSVVGQPFDKTPVEVAKIPDGMSPRPLHTVFDDIQAQPVGVEELSGPRKFVPAARAPIKHQSAGSNIEAFKHHDKHALVKDPKVFTPFCGRLLATTALPRLTIAGGTPSILVDGFRRPAYPLLADLRRASSNKSFLRLAGRALDVLKINAPWRRHGHKIAANDGHAAHPGMHLSPLALPAPVDQLPVGGS
mmetsp:Transcript_48590/g.141509  ORF Transcript_48590/g.141509 Transcript_48590/m.141509 type:complete len:204 (-) Transcript_48590:678-1289(-)